MPTFERTRRFDRDWRALSAEQQEQFREAVEKFVADLRRGRFRTSVRVKRVRGTGHVFEMSWALDGRATFQYGPEVRKGEAHIIWRRIGTHPVLRSP